MAGDDRPDGATHWSEELIVPGLMVGGIGLFMADSLHLSMEAMLLPAALIAVIAVSLVWAVASSLGTARGQHHSQGEDEVPGPIFAAKPWLLVALPAVLVFAMVYCGVLVSLAALVFGAQMIFSRTAPLTSLAIAVAVTVPTWAIFKYVLYARFPAGVFGLG
jgi:hypothetical protein